MFDLTGKVAVVTGAAQGLGRAMALALAEAGADLMLVDRNETGARETAAIIGKLGRSVVVAGCDVAEPAQIRQRLVARHHPVRQLRVVTVALAAVRGEALPTIVNGVKR